MNKPQDIPEFLHFILQERRSYIMDAMRIAEQRKEVPVFSKRFLKVFALNDDVFPKAIVRLMEEGFGERVWSFRAVAA